jgi:hypothetical protein
MYAQEITAWPNPVRDPCRRPSRQRVCILNRLRRWNKRSISVTKHLVSPLA